ILLNLLPLLLVGLPRRVGRIALVRRNGVGTGSRGLDLHAERLAGVTQREQLEPALLHLVLEPVDEMHRREWLVGGERRTVRRAASTFCARVVVEEALPREVFDLPGAPVLHARRSVRIVGR